MMANKIGEFCSEVYVKYSLFLEESLLDYRLADKVLRLGKAKIEAEDKRILMVVKKLFSWIAEYRSSQPEGTSQINFEIEKQRTEQEHEANVKILAEIRLHMRQLDAKYSQFTLRMQTRISEESVPEYNKMRRLGMQIADEDEIRAIEKRNDEIYGNKRQSF